MNERKLFDSLGCLVGDFFGDSGFRGMFGVASG